MGILADPKSTTYFQMPDQDFFVILYTSFLLAQFYRVNSNPIHH